MNGPEVITTLFLCHKVVLDKLTNIVKWWS